jgi:D-alanyl-D-alanine carboxypeptidase
MNERIEGAPYAPAQRRRLLESLDLTRTWMFGREAPPAGVQGDVCDVFVGGTPVFASGGNLSFDYGGGGQVSTTADLARFLAALRAGRPFRHPETTAAMWRFIAPEGLAPPRTGVALGPQRWISRFSGAAMEGHAGAWGAHLWLDPRTGAIVAGAVGQRDDSGFAFRLLDDVAACMGRASAADEIRS